MKTNKKREKQKIQNVEKRPDYTLLRAHHLDALDTESEILESSAMESLNAVGVLLDTGNRSDNNLISYDCARRLNLSPQPLDKPVKLVTFSTDLTCKCTEHAVLGPKDDHNEHIYELQDMVEDQIASHHMSNIVPVNVTEDITRL